jgi:membrane dipeptidase
LEGKIEMLDAYYQAGIRMITLRSDQTDPIDTSDSDEGGESALSAFGRDIVRRMNRLGMIIDITHVPDQLQRDIVKASKAPVIASHSCARALVDIPRNIPDPILQEIAQNGGAVMTTFYSGFLSNDYRARSEEADEKIEKEKKRLEQQFPDNPEELAKRIKDLEETFKPKRADITSLIDHIDHLVKVAGIDHVGVGSDFGGTNTPIGLESTAGFPRITYHLLKRGYTEDQIDRIMGGNLLRVIQKIEDISANL